MVANAASLGWGAWQFEAIEEGLRLTVANSPFAAQANFQDMPACHAIAGMLRAVGHALWGASCSAQETDCACGGAARPCVFEVRPLPGDSNPRSSVFSTPHS